MTATQRHRAAQNDLSSGRGRQPDPALPALLVLGSIAAALLLIGVYVFRAELAALLEWGSSPDPWWRP